MPVKVAKNINSPVNQLAENENLTIPRAYNYGISHVLLIVAEKKNEAPEILWQFLNHLNIYLPHSPTISLSDIYPKEIRALCPHRSQHKDTVCSFISPENNSSVFHQVNG